MKKAILVMLFSSILMLTGCASIVNGTHQTVTVSTPPISGAYCLLSNSKGKWTVDSTPKPVIVHRAYGNLSVSCHKEGYKPASLSVASHTKAMAFGNVLFGGALGAGVDVGDGAAYSYPEQIVVPMAKFSHNSAKNSVKH